MIAAMHATPLPDPAACEKTLRWLGSQLESEYAVYERWRVAYLEATEKFTQWVSLTHAGERQTISIADLANRQHVAGYTVIGEALEQQWDRVWQIVLSIRRIPAHDFIGFSVKAQALAIDAGTRPFLGRDQAHDRFVEAEGLREFVQELRKRTDQ